ncbi:MAG: hypothetical protein KF849_05550 [Rhizobiaceae bacterium]|nr:hypothetical protein [Rhizobiaceae bacterium]
MPAPKDTNRKPPQSRKKHVDPRIDDPSQEATREELDEELVEGLKETFPASDPVAATSTTRTGRPAGRTNQKPPVKR